MKIIRKQKITLSLFIFIILLAVAAWYFIQSRNNKPDKAGEKDSPNVSSRIQVKNGVTTIDLSPSALANSGITTVKLIQTKHQAQLTAYGTVVSVQDLSKDVQSYESNKAQLEKSKESLLISHNNFGRIRSLYEKKLASEQDFQSSQAALLSDQADVSSAESNLSSLKSAILEQWGNNLSKWIFTNSSKLHRLLSLDDALIQISMPSNEINTKISGNIFVQPAYLAAGRQIKISCRFVSAGHLANSQFQTRTLYYIASNTSLSGGMNVKAFLPVGKYLSGVIVPSESIVWYQGKAWIYVEKVPNKFVRIEIDTDNPSDNGFFVPENHGVINPGVTVVKNGAQLLLSEELTPNQSSGGGEGDND